MAHALDLDPRWKALQAMGGVMDIGFDHPAEWTHMARGDQPFVKAGDDQLASELCRFGDQRFICCTLSLAIRGSDEHVVLAIWAEVQHADFYAYVETFDGGPTPAPMVARLASDLGGANAGDPALALSFESPEARPVAELSEVKDISLDHLLDLYEATGTLNRSDLKEK